jgi:hypothetical protein
MTVPQTPFGSKEAPVSPPCCLAMGGQIIDATIIEARRPRLTEAEKETIKGGGAHGISRCPIVKTTARSNHPVANITVTGQRQETYVSTSRFKEKPGRC